MTIPSDQREEKLAELEALLYIHGEPLDFARAMKVLGLHEKDFKELVAELEKRLLDADRGLSLVLHENKLQFVTKPHYHRILESFVKSELTEDLTPASAETLAIIAYFGPLRRSRIDYQRGVNSSFILRSLLLRGLIDRYPDPSHPLSYLYTPSFELLRHLGVSRREMLSEYEAFKSLFERVGHEESREGTEAPAQTEGVLPQGTDA